MDSSVRVHGKKNQARGEGARVTLMHSRAHHCLHDSVGSYAFTSAPLPCSKESESWQRRHTAHLWRAGGRWSRDEELIPLRRCKTAGHAPTGKGIAVGVGFVKPSVSVCMKITIRSSS